MLYSFPLLFYHVDPVACYSEWCFLYTNTTLQNILTWNTVSSALHKSCTPESRSKLEYNQNHLALPLHLKKRKKCLFKNYRRLLGTETKWGNSSCILWSQGIFIRFSDIELLALFEPLFLSVFWSNTQMPFHFFRMTHYQDLIALPDFDSIQLYYYLNQNKSSV